MQQPSTTTTTTTEMWQWQCGTCRAGWKMLRQVTTTCCPHGHGGRCFQGQGTPPPPPLSPSAGSLAPHCHHHHHHHLQEQGTPTSSRALAVDADGSNTDAGRHATTSTTTATLNPAGRPVVAELCWVPDAYLMVQQLREFESLNDELVALRVQLQEYAEEIHKSSKDDMADAGTGMKNVNWFLALPPNVRDVVILARDVIESFIAISTTSAPPAN